MRLHRGLPGRSPLFTILWHTFVWDDMSRFIYGIPVALLGLAVAGCGSDVERADVYKVSGKITLNGAAVPDAGVIFSPRDGQPLATGRTNTNGEYTLTTYEAGDGAAAGAYDVILSKSAPAETSQEVSHEAYASGGALPSHSGPQGGTPQSQSLLPDRYSKTGESGLEATVTPDGENVFNFTLEP